MICGELENKYFGCIEDFEKKRVAYEKERKYQPRIVVDDDEEPVSDEDDLGDEAAIQHLILSKLPELKACVPVRSSSGCMGFWPEEGR